MFGEFSLEGLTPHEICFSVIQKRFCIAHVGNFEFDIINGSLTKIKCYYMTKSIKLNSGKIIAMRDSINKNKKKYWDYIKAENLLSKKEINAGLRTHDLKNLYNEITQMSEKLVYIKGMLMYLNMGITEFDSAAFKKTNNYSIFMACEMKEAICQLKMIPTLDQKTKAQKGLKNIGKDEVFTSAKIAAMIKDLNLKANKFDSDMEKFNNNTEIALDDKTTPMFTNDLAA